MPCIVRGDDESRNKEIALIENIQREDLNPIDKARGFRQLMDEYGMTQQQLSRYNRFEQKWQLQIQLRILNLDPRVMQLADRGKTNMKDIVDHYYGIYTIQTSNMLQQLVIVEKGETVRDIEMKV